MQCNGRVAECRVTGSTRDGNGQSVVCLSRSRLRWPSRASASLHRPAGALLAVSRTSASHVWPAGVANADVRACASLSRPARVHDTSRHAYAQKDWNRMKTDVPDVVAEHSRNGKNRRKSRYRANKRTKATVATKSQTEYFDIGSPLLGAVDGPSLASSDVFEDMDWSLSEVNSIAADVPSLVVDVNLGCMWCSCLDGTRCCQVCGRRLCTECSTHHKCSMNDVDVLPIAMRVSNEFMPFLCDFEALRAMRTCRVAGLGYVAWSRICIKS